ERIPRVEARLEPKRAHLPSLRESPDPHGVVVGEAGEPRAVRAQARPSPFVAGQAHHFVARGDVPEPSHTLRSEGHESLVVLAEVEPDDLSGVELAKQPSPTNVPQAQRL